MSKKYSPYSHAAELGLKKLEIDNGSGYEWDILVLWATPDGRVYQYRGSGCSCNCPEDDFREVETMEEAVKDLERVGSIEQALHSFNSYLNEKEKHDVKRWLEDNLKQ